MPDHPRDSVGDDPAIGDIWAGVNARRARREQLQSASRCALVTAIIAVLTLACAWLMVAP